MINKQRQFLSLSTTLLCSSFLLTPSVVHAVTGLHGTNTSPITVSDGYIGLDGYKNASKITITAGGNLSKSGGGNSFVNMTSGTVINNGLIDNRGWITNEHLIENNATFDSYRGNIWNKAAIQNGSNSVFKSHYLENFSGGYISTNGRWEMTGEHRNGGNIFIDQDGVVTSNGTSLPMIKNYGKITNAGLYENTGLFFNNRYGEVENRASGIFQNNRFLHNRIGSSFKNEGVFQK